MTARVKSSHDHITENKADGIASDITNVVDLTGPEDLSGLAASMTALYIEPV
jgi:hypothetical protein